MPRRAPSKGSLYNRDVVAPEYFAMKTCHSSAHFVERATAFYQAMDALDRVVILNYDADDGGLYLSSVEDE